MATTVDPVGTLATPSRREALARAARHRILLVPDAPLRSRQIGLTVLNQALASSPQTTGLTAYAREKEQFTRWKEAADSRPGHEVTVTGVPREKGIGTHLDLRL